MQHPVLASQPGLDLNLKLQEHQCVGVSKMVECFEKGQVYDEKTEKYVYTRGFLLYDEPGCGKTLQSLCVAIKMQASKRRVKGTEKLPILVIAPTSCLGNWKSEIEKHFGKAQLDVRIFSGGAKRKEAALRNLSGKSIVLCSYGIVQRLGSVWGYDFDPNTVRRDPRAVERMLKVYRKIAPPNPRDTAFEHVLTKFKRSISRRWVVTAPSDEQRQLASQFYRMTWGTMIADEAHRAKDENTVTTKAIALIQSHYRLALTGTPVMNKFQELQNIMRYVLHYRDSQGVEDPASHLYLTCKLGRKKKQVFKNRKRLEPVYYDVVVSVDGFPEDAEVYRLLLKTSRQHGNQLKDIDMAAPQSEYERAMRARRLAAARSAFFTATKAMQLTTLHRDVPIATGQTDLPPPVPFPTEWSHFSHMRFPEWFRRRVETFLLCMRKHSRISRSLGRDIHRLICTWWARAEASIVQPSPKLLAMRDILQRSHRHDPADKMLVFSTSRVFLERFVHPYFNQRGVKTVLLAGGMDKEAVIENFKRPAPSLEAIEAFIREHRDISQLDPSNPYLLTFDRRSQKQHTSEIIGKLLKGEVFPNYIVPTIHAKSKGSITLNFGPAHVLAAVKQVAGVGLNFQDVSHTVVIAEPYWNASLDEQCIARVDRIGQTKRPRIYRLLLANSVDFGIRHVQRVKQESGTIILDKNEAPPKIANAIFDHVEWNPERALIPTPQHPVTYNQRFLSLTPVDAKGNRVKVKLTVKLKPKHPLPTPGKAPVPVPSRGIVISTRVPKRKNSNQMTTESKTKRSKALKPLDSFFQPDPMGLSRDEQLFLFNDPLVGDVEKDLDFDLPKIWDWE